MFTPTQKAADSSTEEDNECLNLNMEVTSSVASVRHGALLTNMREGSSLLRTRRPIDRPANAHYPPAVHAVAVARPEPQVPPAHPEPRGCQVHPQLSVY